MADDTNVSSTMSGQTDASLGSSGIDNSAPLTRADLDAFREGLLKDVDRINQSWADKTAARSDRNFQAYIDKFRQETGVTLTQAQAAEYAQHVSRQNNQEQPMPQQTAQTAPAEKPDSGFEGFKYYHQIQDDNPIWRQAYEMQKVIGTQLLNDDPEYKKYFAGSKRYSSAEFVQTFRNALIEKAMRLNAPQEETAQTQAQVPPTNMGSLPLVGSQGKKSNGYDPKRSSKAQIGDYLKTRNLKS